MIRNSIQSILFLLILSIAFPLWAQAPVILISDNEEGLVPVHPDSLDVQVEITGFLAETQIEMHFINPNDQVLEGELVFPLPEGAVVTGYGLDVGGEIVEGVAIERQRARVAFEAETRQRVDPGLLEWVQGSVYRTRIFPFPAGGGRTIRVSYTSDLATSSEGTYYRLPLAYQEALSTLNIRVVVNRGEVAPTVTAGLENALTFCHWEEEWVAEKQLSDITPQDDLVIALPDAQAAPLVEQSESGEIHFAASAQLPFEEVTTTPLAYDRVVLLYDASSSRIESDQQGELDLIAAWSEANPHVQIELVALRDRLEHIQTFPSLRRGAGGRAGDIVRRINEIPLDGGTDLSELRFSQYPDQFLQGMGGEQIDLYLFLGDGLGTMGQPGRLEPKVPVFSINSSTQANHRWLEYLAESSGGAYLNLQRITQEEALGMMGQTPARLSRIIYNTNDVDRVEVSSRLAGSGQVSIAGRLKAESAEVELVYAMGQAEIHRVSFHIDRSMAEPGELVTRYWAQLRINTYSLSPERYTNRIELLSLGQRYNLVTPHTSYLVLETLEQHLTHLIPPAESRTEMFRAYTERVAAMEVEKEQGAQVFLERVVNDWQRRVRWWETGAFNIYQDVEGEVIGEINDRNNASDSESSFGFQGNENPVIGPVDDFEEFEIQEEDDGPGGFGVHLEGVVEDDVSRSEFHLQSEASPETGSVEFRRSSSSSGGVGLGSSGSGMGRGGIAQDTSSAQPSAASQEVERPREQTIAIDAWNPDTPYLQAMAGLSSGEAYGVYLEQLESYARTPAFYLDVANHLYSLEADSLALRVLGNISEMGLEDARLYRIMAYKLQEEGELDLAVRMFEEVYRLRPEEPQSLRDLALALSARGDRADNTLTLTEETLWRPIADWRRAVELIDELVRSDAGRFWGIQMPAVMEANRILARMERYRENYYGAREAEWVSPLDPRLIQNLEMDLRVILRWDTDNTDMDLWVTEPSGEKCYYANTYSGFRAMYGRDYTGGYGPEEYLLREAPDGEYFVQANFYGSRQNSLTGGTTLQVEMFTDWGRPTERRESVTVRLTSTGEVIDIGRVAFEEGEPR